MLMQRPSKRELPSSLKKKSSPFSEDIDSYVLISEEIKQLETRSENQISKTTLLEIKTKTGKFIPKNRTSITIRQQKGENKQ